ncbi:hypothetical protein WJX74_009800 [Apatococcus lobatus]|uniref:Uncharacterized protein n=1 Tax=Apatococcus lobatus TaxID=904363 RepID=A0AAW1S3V2_9CHLO
MWMKHAVRSILSDSKQFLASHREEHVISVRGVCGVRAVQSEHSSLRSGEAVLACQHCSTEVGKLMPAGAAIWLHVSAISSHQLGTYDMQIGGADVSDIDDEPSQATPSQEASPAADQNMMSGVQSLLQQQQSELLQVQSMLLLHHERLTQLELQGSTDSGMGPVQRNLDHQLDTS